ncbi:MULTISPECIES: GIY-YIG nuclease family protein [Pseudoalteromonas]|uniref:GIY-YIG nuclease family protein n=1 Tax=Pseudoalteromonas TaxID=53246 RepID=UPI00165EA25E|nr:MULTISPECIES: GIY-YIG nuclease family protein [Pseudoalteromonas]MDQ2042963.1 GIY-YIG nuclease family protein [Pseudoalteromonas sp. 20-92]
MTINNEKSLHHIESCNVKRDSTWYLYIVQTRFGHWYTGITTNVEKRFATHQVGKGAKNLRGKGPLLLIHQQKVGSKSDASKLEHQIKKLTKVRKEAYVLNFKKVDINKTKSL